MADTLCGPSNPIQTFQKHTAVDRTLQQDRIAPHQPVVERFRSSPGPNAGILDTEFEAFKAGHLDGGLFTSPPFAFQNVPTPANANTHSPNWAIDFQNANLNQARSSPISQAQFRQEAPIQHKVPGGWHQEFMRQQRQPQTTFQPQQRSYSTFAPINSNYHQNVLSPGAGQKRLEEHEVDPVLDQEAMEQAFEALSATQSVQEGSQAPINLAKDFHEMHPFEEIRIGSDRILEESQRAEEEGLERNEADELAKTAGQLLDNVKHDQSEKFQQSSFLSLMRQIRDREVHVEGDKLVDPVGVARSLIQSQTAKKTRKADFLQTPQPLHPGGHLYPNDTVSPGHHFDDSSDEGLSSMKLG